jgi:predicted ribosomally synthesized peptide with SipW-like signal peptide
MNSKLVKASLAGAAAIALAAGGGTFAAWSDFNVWDGNQSGAGTLTLSTNTPDSQTFHVGNLTPGQVWENETYLLSNQSDSTPNGKLYISLQNLVGQEDGCQGNSEVVDDNDCATTNAGEFPADAKVFIKTKSSDEATCGVQPTGSDAPGGFEKAIYGGGLDLLGASPATEKSLSDMATAGQIQLIRPGTPTVTFDPSIFKPGEGVCAAIYIYLPQTVSNEVQGDQATFDLRADLEQAV